MSKFLLDTNIVSILVRQPAGELARRIGRMAPQTVATSIVVAAEMKFGAIRKASKRLMHDVEAVLGSIEIVPLDAPTDLAYARIRTELERAGTPISNNDLWIAAHALALNCTLVTANEREFRRVPGLAVENWTA